MKRALGKDSLHGLHIALQGAGSVATGVALHACAEGAKLSIADVDQAKAQKLADATGGKVVSPDEILGLEADVLSPYALGAILTEAVDRRAEDAGRRRRREQPARDPGGRRAAARARHPLRARLRHQRRRDHQRLHRISRRRRRQPGPPADRGHSGPARADLGRERRDAAAIRRPSPTLWRKGSSEGHKRDAMHALANPARFLRFARPADGLAAARSGLRLPLRAWRRA